jgi:hypothetical protein
VEQQVSLPLFLTKTETDIQATFHVALNLLTEGLLIFFGEGDTAPVTHEILRQAESDSSRRPAVHVGD